MLVDSVIDRHVCLFVCLFDSVCVVVVAGCLTHLAHTAPNSRLTELRYVQSFFKFAQQRRKKKTFLLVRSSVISTLSFFHKLHCVQFLTNKSHTPKSLQKPYFCKI